MNRYTCADLGPWWEVLIEGVVKVAHQGEISELQPDYATGIEQRSSFRRGILEVVRLRHPSVTAVPVEEMFESFSKLPHFVHLRDLIIKYGADPSEIRAGNLGITADGRVVLIDSATPGR